MEQIKVLTSTSGYDVAEGYKKYIISFPTYAFRSTVEMLDTNIDLEDDVVYGLREDNSLVRLADIEHDDFIDCAICGETVCYDDTVYNPEHGHGRVCISCHEQSFNMPIKRYYYKPKPSLFGRGDFFIGMELEVESLDDLSLRNKAREISSDFFYCKDDSSINNGFEIVTHPFTLNFERETGTIKKLTTKLRNLQLGGLEDHFTNVGIHIHVTKTAFTKGSLYKLMYFVGKNKEFIEKIADRRGNRYCTTHEFSSPRSLKNIIVNERTNHHSMIAVAGQTVEFRMFASSTVYTTIMSYIEFVYALTEFVNNTIIHNISVDNFKSFVNSSEYLNLKNKIKWTED